MRHITLAILCLSLSWQTGGGQASEGTLHEGLTLESEILGTAVRYSVYLPADYPASTESYPVAYLLHGGNGNETSLVRSTEVHRTADRLISDGTVLPMILVMPSGTNTRYLNNHDGSFRYEDFFFDEFIPHIEATYRVVSEKGSRAVAGTSMGGYGSLVYALLRPETFAAAVSISGSFCEDERILEMSIDQWNQSTRGPVYGLDLEGEARFTSHYRAHDPCYLVQEADRDMLDTVSLYLDCGDDDFRNEGNAALHVLMRRLGIPHEYRVRDGGHTAEYFRSGLADGLRFIDAAFRSP